MSRDRRARPEDRDPAPSAGPSTGPSAGPEDDRSAELLTAYVDGVAELPADERRAVERWLADAPGARADADAVHSLLGQLRALPPTYDTGEPPDWAAMERSIRQAVDAEAPRRWWRSWRWLVPAMTCTAAAAVALALWPRLAQSPGPISAVVPEAEQDRAAPSGHEPPGTPGGDLVALWLDGSEVDVDVDLDLARPEAVDQMLGQMMGSTLGSTLGDPLPGPAGDPAPRADELDAALAPVDELGVLPPSGMAWVDDLDDAALDRAEHLLAAPPAGEVPGGSARRKG